MDARLDCIRGRRAGLIVATVAFYALGLASPGGLAAQQVPPGAADPKLEKADKGAVPLASSVLRTTVTRLEAGQRAPRAANVSGGKLPVELIIDPDSGGAVRGALQRQHGTITGSVERTLLQTSVPADHLVALERHPSVRFVRPPTPANIPMEPPPTLERLIAEAPSSQPTLHPRVGSGDRSPRAVTGQQVTKTNAAQWHASGFTGAGIKIGIVDGFGGSLWGAAQAAGEVPAPAGTFCRDNGSACDIFTVAGASRHGVGVAEAIHEMAPQATLYLATADSVSDLQGAIDFFAANGVQIVSRSLGSPYESPGNGTGPFANVVNSAAARGITWFNSAGNSAGRPGPIGTYGNGSYFRGSWRDGNGNGWLEFNAGGDELMAFDCNYIHGLRWSDWGTNRTDYDAFIYNETATTLFSSSEDTQGPSSGPPPIEPITCPNSLSGTTVYLAVKLFSAGGGTTGDTFEFLTNGFGVEHSTNPHSAGSPVVDSASPGLVSVGAIEPVNSGTIADYSAEGPTNDGRMKPELSAASCFSSFIYTGQGGNCANGFNGTSAAAPVVAGAAALALDAGEANTPGELRSFLTEEATQDRGSLGPDNVFGAGELILPAPGGAAPDADDSERPRVKALKSGGKKGKVTRLRYRAYDNSGTTKEIIRMKQRRKRWDTVRTKFGEATGQKVYTTWHVPKRVPKGRLKFCVTAKDRAGNRSREDCARLALK
jgi:hypothetical protein